MHPPSGQFGSSPPFPRRVRRRRVRKSRTSIEKTNGDFEMLEDRRLFSVTVTQGYPGIYEIHGDDSPDHIDVSVSMTDDTFTLDGTTYSEVTYISVDAGGGNDTINLISNDGEGSIAAGVIAGDGNDSVSLNFDGGVWGGSGNDTIHLVDSYRGQAIGEGGNDRIYISGACVNAEVNGGDGHDLIDATDSAGGQILHGGAGDDTIIGSAYNDQIYGDDGRDLLFGADGNDTFYAQDGNADTIDGGSGNDILYMDWQDWDASNIEQIFYLG